MRWRIPLQPVGEEGSATSCEGPRNSIHICAAANGSLPVLQVGTFRSPTRYSCEGWATVMHRAGVVATGSIATIVRDRENGTACDATAFSHCRFRGRREAGSPEIGRAHV